jgi:hypothetical protein
MNSVTTKLATVILNDLLKKDILTNALSKRTLDLIEHNLNDNELVEFKDDILVSIKLFQDYLLGNYFVKFIVIKVINALIIFLSSPENYLQKINYNKINNYDKTNSKLKRKIVKLGLALIDQNLLEYNSNKHHKEIIKTSSNRLIY